MIKLVLNQRTNEAKTHRITPALSQSHPTVCHTTPSQRNAFNHTVRPKEFMLAQTLFPTWQASMYASTPIAVVAGKLLITAPLSAPASSNFHVSCSVHGQSELSTTLHELSTKATSPQTPFLYSSPYTSLEPKGTHALILFTQPSSMKPKSPVAPKSH